MSHVTGVFASGGGGGGGEWVVWGGERTVQAFVFHTVLPGKVLGTSGKGWRRFWLSSFLELGGRSGLWNPAVVLVFTFPPLTPPRRILTGKGFHERLGGSNSAE